MGSSTHWVPRTKGKLKGKCKVCNLENEKKEEENLYYSKLEMMKNLFLCVWTPDVLFNINYVRVIALFVDAAS